MDSPYSSLSLSLRAMSIVWDRQDDDTGWQFVTDLDQCFSGSPWLAWRFHVTGARSAPATPGRDKRSRVHPRRTMPRYRQG